MPKVKKATPKKPVAKKLVKKTVVKKPAAKVVAKKSVAKPAAKKTVAKAKAPAKKPLAAKNKVNVKAVVNKKTTSKANTKAKKSTKVNKANEHHSLYNTFLSSLTSLGNFWAKKEAALKKQIEGLKSKTDKTSSKQKTAKNSHSTLTQAKKGKLSAAQQRKIEKAKLAHQDIAQQLNHMQAHMQQTRLEFLEAKATANKYMALNKMIHQFEKEWAANTKQQLDDNKTEPSVKKAKSGKISQAVSKLQEIAHNLVSGETKTKTTKASKAPKKTSAKKSGRPKKTTALNNADDYVSESLADEDLITAALPNDEENTLDDINDMFDTKGEYEIETEVEQEWEEPENEKDKVYNR